MKKCDLKLKELIQREVLPEIEDHLDELFQTIAQTKQTTDEQREEIEQMHELREEFELILKDIENRELDKQECALLYDEITAMLEDFTAEEE